MTSANTLSARIDIIERGYEYLLAYAAQGRQSDEGSEARERLRQMFSALEGFAESVAEVVHGASNKPVPEVEGFLEAVEQDARRARGAIGLVLTRPDISSLLVDNLNASIHLRALLTDCFLVEQAYK